jgi:hypothetical protein
MRPVRHKHLLQGAEPDNLLAVPILDILGEEGMACGSVNYPCCVNVVSVVVQHEDPIRTEEQGGQVHDLTQLYLGILIVPLRSPVLRLHMGY